jgi:hypothetical protein
VERHLRASVDDQEHQCAVERRPLRGPDRDRATDDPEQPVVVDLLAPGRDGETDRDALTADLRARPGSDRSHGRRRSADRDRPASCRVWLGPTLAVTGWNRSLLCSPRRQDRPFPGIRPGLPTVDGSCDLTTLGGQ